MCTATLKIQIKNNKDTSLPNFPAEFKLGSLFAQLLLLGVRNFYKSCMDTDGIEENSVSDLKEIISRLGGWPVVEGDSWSEDNFHWWDLSMKAAAEGLGTDRIISIGIKYFPNI